MANDSSPSERSVVAAEAPTWTGLIGLGLALSAYFVVAISAIAVRSPLGHDESVYALRGRDLVHGWSHLSGTYWADYRAPGLPLLISLSNRLVGEHVTTSRFVVVLSGAAVLILMWFLGRALGNRHAGTVGAVLLTMSAGFMYSASSLLADVPGAAFSLGAVLVFAIEIRRGFLRWSFLAVPVLAVAATLVRFGAPFMIGAGLVAAFVIAVPRMWRSRDWVSLAQSVALAVATGLAVALVLFTHLIVLGELTPARANSALTGGKGLSPSTGFSDLAQVVNPWSTWPVPLWSKAVVVIVACGVVAAWVGMALGRVRYDLVLFGTIAGVLSTVGVTASVGLVVANYLALTLPFWALVAGVGLYWLGSVGCAALPGRQARLVLLAMVGVIALALLVASAQTTRHYHDRNKIAYGVLQSTSIAAGSELGPGCAIVTSYSPQVGYYSTCLISTFDGWNRDLELEEIIRRSIDRVIETTAVVPRRQSTAVLTVDGGKRQPVGVELENPEVFGRVVIERGVEGDGRSHVVVRQIEQCVFDAVDADRVARCD